MHGLLGPSRAGKTSLLRVLATVATPASGSVRLLGHDVGGGTSGHSARTAVRRRLGYVPQEFGCYPHFTVREFVTYVAYLKEMPAEATPEAVERAVDRVGLTERIDSKIRRLSWSMVRRVGFAQALVNDPDVLLLDEPTPGLSAQERTQLRSLLQQVGATSTVVVATDRVAEVAGACTDMTMLYRGRIVYQDTPAALARVAAGTMDAEQVANTSRTDVERGYLTVLRRHRAASQEDAAGVPTAAPAKGARP